MALSFFGIGEKWPFPVCDHCWVFQICWCIESNTFTASSFRIWNSSTGIPSPPLALFMVMLPKAHLTLHSRMSGSRWVTTPSWLSRSLRPFLYNFSVYSRHLFLISSASVRYHFCHVLCPSLHETFPWYLWVSWEDLQSFPFCWFWCSHGRRRAHDFHASIPTVRLFDCFALMLWCRYRVTKYLQESLDKVKIKARLPCTDRGAVGRKLYKRGILRNETHGK